MFLRFCQSVEEKTHGNRGLEWMQAGLEKAAAVGVEMRDERCPFCLGEGARLDERDDEPEKCDDVCPARLLRDALDDRSQSVAIRWTEVGCEIRHDTEKVLRNKDGSRLRPADNFPARGVSGELVTINRPAEFCHGFFTIPTGTNHGVELFVRPHRVGRLRTKEATKIHHISYARRKKERLLTLW